MTTAREREVYKKEMTKTGGGSLTPKQKKIANNLLYEDLAAKLGVSATGNDARFDNDSSSSSSVKPPTERLRKRLNATTSEHSEISDSMAEQSDSDISIATVSTMGKLSSTFEGNKKMYNNENKICHLLFYIY